MIKKPLIFSNIGCDFMISVPRKFHGYIDVVETIHGDTEQHTHDFLEFVYILEGHAVHRLGGTVSTVGPHDFFVVNYQTAHEYEAKGESLHLINCFFVPELLDRTFAGLRNFNDLAQRYFLHACGKHILGPSSDTVFHDADGTVGWLFLQMMKECRDKQTGYEEVLRCLLSHIVIETVRQVGSGMPISGAVRALVDAVDRDYAGRVSLAALCREQHYSVPYVSTLFRQEVGMTFTAYLQGKRIAESCNLLEDTDDSITAIAGKVGYAEVKFFNRVFRRVMGMSAREYRRRVRGPKA